MTSTVPQPMTEPGSSAMSAIDASSPISDLQHLSRITTIGSTVDPINGNVNPYGLDVAKISAGKIHAGDLVVCNFNDAANVQGTGTSIIALHNSPGSKPLSISRSKSLLGCDALALTPTNFIWAADFAANNNPIVLPNGVILTTLPQGPWHNPFGETFAPNGGHHGGPAFYVSNAADGSIVRVNIDPGPSFSFDTIVTGFAVNHGAPGSILSPSGLQYDIANTRLYVIDGTNNTVVAINDVRIVHDHGIAVNPDGKTFSGPFKNMAHLVFAGAPLNGPISSALLPDGHLVIGNTLDPAGKNLLVEITPAGKLVAVKNVDTGAAGALFGMVATGRHFADTKLYFNDDNDNTVKVLTP